MILIHLWSIICSQYFFYSKNTVYLSIYFASSFIFFINILQFSEYRSFASLGRLIPRYFIVFDAMASGVVSLISLSDILLLQYRSAIGLYTLILHFATSLNSLIERQVLVSNNNLIHMSFLLSHLKSCLGRIYLYVMQQQGMLSKKCHSRLLRFLSSKADALNA